MDRRTDSGVSKENRLLLQGGGAVPWRQEERVRTIVVSTERMATMRKRAKMLRELAQNRRVFAQGIGNEKDTKIIIDEANTLENEASKIEASIAGNLHDRLKLSPRYE